MSKRGILAVCAVVLAAAALAFGSHWVQGAPVAAIGTAPAATAGVLEIGVPQSGWASMEYVGRIEQDAGNLASFGYLTYLPGLSGSSLFTSPATSELTARFTYYTTATITARSVISSVFTLNSVGVTTFYYYPYGASADFATPHSFTAGQPIGSASGRYQSTLNVQSPNAGVASVFGELTRQTMGTFILNAQTYRFGRDGMMERHYFAGEGVRTDPVAPKSFTVGSGNGLYTSQAGPYMPTIVSQMP
jgi:hypothetical protein